MSRSKSSKPRPRTDVHPTVEVTLKRVRVDKLIAPLVNWLNQHEDIITLWSCQGDSDIGVPVEQVNSLARPYVMFICTSPVALLHILERISAECRVVPYNGVLRYTLEFRRQSDMLRSIDILRARGEVNG